jgi:hypothetical protein
LHTLTRLGTRPSPARNTPKHKPPIAPLGSLLALTATAPLHLSSTIFRKASRRTTQENNSEKNENFLRLFRNRVPVLRRQDIIRWAIFQLDRKVGIWKEAQELLITSEPDINSLV